jgi:hypothetical protein
MGCCSSKEAAQTAPLSRPVSGYVKKERPPQVPILPISSINNPKKQDPVAEAQKIPSEFAPNEDKTEKILPQDPQLIKDKTSIPDTNDLPPKESSSRERLPSYENKLSKDYDESIEEGKINNDDDLDCHEIENNMQFMDTGSCDHQFSWKPDLVYREMIKHSLQDSPILITCFRCRKIFSKPSWQCNNCEYIICNSCGENEALAKPVIKCTRGHETTWSIDTWAYQLEKKKSNRPTFICSTCRKTLQEPAYICRACIYYSCMACSRNKGLYPPINALVCNHGDPLVQTKVTGDPFNCRECGRPANDTCYNCKNCNETLCKNCALKVSLTMVRHPGLRCRKGDLTMGLTDVKGIKNREKQFCISCVGSVASHAMICVDCLDRCCLDCSDNIQNQIEKNVGKNLDEIGYVQWYKYIDLESSQTIDCCLCSEQISTGIYFYSSNDNSICCKCLNERN